MIRQLAPRFLSLSTATTVAVLFFINFCHLVFQCGCRSMWNGGVLTCNIQQAGPPDCPWCRPEWWSGYTPLYVILAVQAAITLWPGKLSAVKRFVLALAAFPIVGGLLAVVMGEATGYWSL